MVQLPAGTIEDGEEAPEAAVRELFEETGVESEPGILAGILDEEWEGEARRRWVYLLEAASTLPDEWPFHCDCGVPTLCHWLPLESAEVFPPQQAWLDTARSFALE